MGFRLLTTGLFFSCLRVFTCPSFRYTSTFVSDLPPSMFGSSWFLRSLECRPSPVLDGRESGTSTFAETTTTLKPETGGLDTPSLKDNIRWSNTPKQYRGCPLITSRSLHTDSPDYFTDREHEQGSSFAWHRHRTHKEDRRILL